MFTKNNLDSIQIKKINLSSYYHVRSFRGIFNRFQSHLFVPFSIILAVCKFMSITIQESYIHSVVLHMLQHVDTSYIFLIVFIWVRENETIARVNVFVKFIIQGFLKLHLQINHLYFTSFYRTIRSLGSKWSWLHIRWIITASLWHNAR